MEWLMFVQGNTVLENDTLGACIQCLWESESAINMASQVP